MRRYFDAHVYVANWCTCLLCLRVPKSAFDAETLRAFKTQTVFSVEQTKTHWLLGLGLDESDNYDRFAEEDGRGWMGRLAPLRDELLRGDMRPLYLGWLAGVSAGEVDEKATEPQPPPGLSRLTAAQQSLVEFLEVDEDLLAAAGLSDQQGSKPDSERDAELDVWIAALPVAEKTAMLKPLLTGNAQQAERKLKLRFLAWQREQQPIEKPGTRRTVAELQRLAASAAEARKRQEAVRRKKAEAERQAKRETYLRTLTADFDPCWQAADKLAERGIASAYDEVKRALVDLSDAYAIRYKLESTCDRCVIVDDLAMHVLFCKEHALVFGHRPSQGFVRAGCVGEAGGIQSCHVVPVTRSGHDPGIRLVHRKRESPWPSPRKDAQRA